MTELLEEKPNITIPAQMNVRAAKEAGLPAFKIFGTIKALDPVEGGDTTPRILLTASTSLTDLAGDVMTQQGMEKMKAAAPGTTVFMNHRYDVPDDVFGVVESATIVKRQLTNLAGFLEDALCLDYVVRVETSNSAAMRCYAMIANGTRLGASIGILILDATFDANGQQLINDLIYLEVSLVGIPMNQQSWVQSAIKALKQFWPDGPQQQQEEPKPKPKELPAPRAGQVLTSANNLSPEKKEVKKKMTKKQPRRMERKDLFGAALAESDASDLWDYTWALQDAISDLINRCEAGTSEDPEGELDEILAGFTAAIKAKVTPALLLNQDTGDDATADEDEDAGDTGASDDEAGADATDAETKSALRFLNARKGQAILTRKDSDSDQDNDDDSDSDSDTDDSDSDHAQQVHDFCVKLGASCYGMDGQDDMTDKSGKKLARTVKDLQKRVDTLETEKDNWQAIAEAATEAVERLGRQPLAL